MLIWINSSVVNSGNENTWEPDTVVALEHLASARREGKHIVIAERETLKKIAQCSHLSQIARDIYNKLFNQSAQLQSYLSVVSRYIEVDDSCYAPQVVSHSGKKIIKVQSSLFNDSELVQKTILLAENLHDAFLYEYIAKVYLAWNREQGINLKISCEHRGGGGNTIATEYSQIQRLKKRFCLCIVDSDKKAPDGNLGCTASNIKSQDDHNCITTELLILNLRESENLIPNSILRELCLGNLDRIQALRIFEEIQNSTVKEIRGFLDFKTGTLMKEIFSINNPSAKAFWETKISSIPSITKRVDLWCQNHWKCSNNKECKCKISLGFGERTLENTVDYCNKKSPHKIAEIVDEQVRQSWEDIGQLIMNWCIASDAIRA